MMNLQITSVPLESGAKKPIETKALILGSGPAGLAAALYTARADLNPVVISGIELGGQAAVTNIIENYPGFPEGVGGQQLGDLFQKQAENFGARIEFDTASEVDLSTRPFVVKGDNNNYLAQTLIIATGASPTHLNVPGEKELIGKGVSYCGTCDGWFFRGKNVAVIGGGDSAVEEGLFLTRFASAVTIIHRRDSLRANAILQRRAQENPKIQYIWNTVITGVLGEKAVEGVSLKNLKNEEESTLPFEGVFVFIGHKPNSSLFRNALALNEQGYILIDNLMRTNIPGVFAAGEVADPNYKQVVTSAGMGAAAGMQAVKFLASNS
jgi:thioredoxin reductase (NADPH)